MNARVVFERHRRFRWLVPIGVIGVIALAASGAFSASAAPSLPARTAAQLLADIEQARLPGLSGTIVANADLGLPELPSVGVGATDDGSLTSLLTGSHTIRVWYGGLDQQRVALLAAVGETDVFRDGQDLWQWSSDAKTATHLRLPAATGAVKTAPALPGGAALTPQQLAEQAVAAIDPSTAVTVDANRRVADRAAYDLVLTPRDTASRVGSVRIAIDGQHKIPIGVQIFARGEASPAIDVSFTQISFVAPSPANFKFIPPKGATVTEQSLDSFGSADGGARGEPTVIGAGWTSIVELPADLAPSPTDRAGADASGAASGPSGPSGRATRTMAPGSDGSGAGGSGSGSASQLIGQLTTQVSGSWGRGQLFESTLVTALFTDDGRVFAGAVDPSALYAAATGAK
ncbi:MAG: hypothetical protein FWD74_00285 [Actinomycetia bacterium]|nr:hypothetical protein [Actinomycetes bacterium]